MKLDKYLLYVLFMFLVSSSSYAEDKAKLIFSQSSPMVLQVKVIDKASGNKSTIGSGFQVSSSGVIATNYHVVSDFILDPEKYSIEVLDHNDKAIDATLINFDIVHDLALLKIKNLEMSALNLSQTQPSQGNRIYSMGNPHDLGMTIIEGTYNGLVEGSRYQKYLFSGSLNSGMSGGPVLNNAGDVIGVNVSKGGEQISFLVPVKHLKALMEQGYEPLNLDEYGDHA
ncbi:MAG: trypsin-like peptidase domain-containing protein, partial [Gammaproteobacteria bacterium]|nr:trypsin-like peptidase domain-containing protein [Gammaproteobacteria bacterium]